MVENRTFPLSDKTIVERHLFPEPFQHNISKRNKGLTFKSLFTLAEVAMRLHLNGPKLSQIFLKYNGVILASNPGDSLVNLSATFFLDFTYSKARWNCP